MRGCRTMSLDEMAARIDAILAAPDEALRPRRRRAPTTCWRWAKASSKPGSSRAARRRRERTVEGFRLLALHRQGARGEPSFNACRETCRELVYHHNLVRLDPANRMPRAGLRLGAMVARHLALFIGGKLEVAGLGEFCCSSRPLRQREAAPSQSESVTSGEDDHADSPRLQSSRRAALRRREQHLVPRQCRRHRDASA